MAKLPMHPRLPDHNARVLRLARDYDKKFRPVLIPIAKHMNLDTGESFLRVEMIMRESARYTDKQKPRSRAQVFKLLAEMTEKGAIKTVPRFDGTTHRQRSSYRHIDFHVAIKLGQPVFHDWDAPLDTESDMRPLNMSSAAGNETPHETADETPHETPITTSELSPELSKELPTNSPEEAAADGTYREDDCPADKWDGIYRYRAIFWTGRDGATGLMTVDLAREKGFYGWAIQYAREVLVSGYEWQHAQSLGDADRLAFLTGLADDNPAFHDIREELYQKEVKEAEYARRRAEAVAAVPKLRKSAPKTDPWDTPEYRANVARARAGRTHSNVVIHRAPKKTETADDVIRRLIPLLR